jgi:hypothetical protein
MTRFWDLRDFDGFTKVIPRQFFIYLFLDIPIVLIFRIIQSRLFYDLKYFKWI